MAAIEWKPVLIEKLKDYSAQKNAIESIPMEIERLELERTRIQSSLKEFSPVQGGSSREDMLLSNIVHREELKILLREAKLEVKRMDAGLAVLTEEERILLERFYIYPQRGVTNRICEEWNIDERSVRRRKIRALKHLTEAMYHAEQS